MAANITTNLAVDFLSNDDMIFSDLNECSSNPCQNSVTFANEFASYKCFLVRCFLIKKSRYVDLSGRCKLPVMFISAHEIINLKLPRELFTAKLTVDFLSNDDIFRS